LPMFGALYYWFPKFTGRLLDERLGHLNFWRRRSSSCPLSIALSCSPEACPCIGRTRL
jgi:heme/copper-type cytochrome/quinol oxidase subunit 1